MQNTVVDYCRSWIVNMMSCCDICGIEYVIGKPYFFFINHQNGYLLPILLPKWTLAKLPLNLYGGLPN